MQQRCGDVTEDDARPTGPDGSHGREHVPRLDAEGVPLPHGEVGTPADPDQLSARPCPPQAHGIEPQ